MVSVTDLILISYPRHKRFKPEVLSNQRVKFKM